MNTNRLAQLTKEIKTNWFFGSTKLKILNDWVVVLPATSRHTSHSLWLLPSGPDQVHELLLREDQ